MATDNSPRPEPPEEPRAPSGDPDAWIEQVVGIAGHLGFNKMRLRWKLMRWQQNRRRRANQRAQVVTHITYAHKTCQQCGAIQDKDEPVCTKCGTRLESRRMQVLGRIGLAMPVPLSVSTLLTVAIIIAYGKVWIAAGGGLRSPGGDFLIAFGGRWPPAMSDEPWRLVTAIFLHAGLLHLLFNVLAIANVGPRIEELYGKSTMLALFLVTGVLANVGSLEMSGYGVGIGASGGVMGLVGAAAAAGHRARTGRGRALRDAMLSWSLYTFIFGFAIGADNWAHLFGGLAGAAFGFAVRPEAWARNSLIVVRGAAGALGLMVALGALAIILTRTPPPPRDLAAEAAEDDDAEAAQPGFIERSIPAWGEVCTQLYRGDAKAADARVASLFTDVELRMDGHAPSASRMCESFQEMRDYCRAGDRERSASKREPCKRYQALFDRLPARPVPPAAPEAR